MTHIHGEDVHRRSADGRAAEQDGLIPFEMVLPPIPPRVEQSRQLPSGRIDSSDVGSLVIVAREARECEVLEIICVVMFPGDHMVDLKREDVESLGKAAILADLFRPCPDLVNKRGVQTLLGVPTRVQPHARLGLQQRQNVSSALVRVDLAVLIVRQLSIASPCRKVVHSLSILRRKVEREEHFGGLRR